VELDNDGSLNLLQLFPDATSEGGEVEVIDEGPTLALGIDTIEVTGGGIHFIDHQPSTLFVRLFSPVDITVSNFSNERDESGQLKFFFRNSDGESVSTDGTFTITPVTADLKLDVANISIPVHQPYIDELMKVDIRQGGISTSGRFTLASSGAINYRGEAKINDLSAMESGGTDDVFTLKQLSANGIDLGLKPTYLNIAEVTLSSIFARVVVNPEGGLNLSAIMVAGEKGEGEAEVEATPPTEERVPISIGSVVIESGRVSFSDKQVVPNYSAEIDIDGKVLGLSSDEAKGAEVSLAAKIDKYAPLSITGTISPLSGDLFADLAIDFKDFELSSISPYSGKYIGKAIDRGKLYLDLTYLIKKRKLDSQNRVVLDQITLGERIESNDATSLPVGFALALLKDRQGRVNLDLPVSGSLDDPEFSVAGIVVKMFVNLLVKAATSPFALLGAIFGGGEEISYVEFAPGSSTLTADGLSKLDNLISALYERPNLNLDIEGYVDIAVDTESLRNRRFERAVKQEKFRRVAEKFRRVAKRGETASVDDIEIKPEEYEKYLWRAYKRAEFPKEKTMLRLTKKLPAEDMKRLMLEHIVITDDDLRALADERSKSVKDYIFSTGKVEPERVFIVWPDSLKAGDKEGAEMSRVEFKLK
jgi:hypothetical protein